MKQKILLIEEDTCSRLAIVRSLSEKGYAVSVASNLANAEEDVLARRFDAVIIGINLCDGKGSGFIRRIRVYDHQLPILAITGCDEIEIAVDAVRCGADNVLAKPIDFADLCASLKTLLEELSAHLPPPVGKLPGNRDGGFFGTGPAARAFHQLAAQAAASDGPVLITGETGTGKGMLARWIHQNGERSPLPFAALYCSGLRGDLLAAELFGARSGTGTGWVRCIPGLLEMARGGTLFLDEIGDMDLAVQAELLAALQSAPPPGSGDGEDVETGIRLICSSNHQLDALACGGTFLPELLSYISATVLRIPPLRERLRELPGIVRHLLDGMRDPQPQITDGAMRVLKGYRWPGNLRELKNALEQGLLLSHGARLCPEHFNWLKPAFRAKQPRPLLTLSELKQRQSDTGVLALNSHSLDGRGLGGG